MKKISKKAQFIDAMAIWGDHVKYGSLAYTEAYNEMTNLCASRPDHISFYEWVKQTEWTLGAVMALFHYQCIMLNGGIDWPAFEDMYFCFKAKIYPWFE